MNKTVKKVFILVAILVGIFIAWELIFNNGGILRTGYNSLANGINKLWGKVAGSGETILAQWTTSTASDNGTAFNMETTVH